jgi:quercetin 2,3-dioxygenase
MQQYGPTLIFSICRVFLNPVQCKTAGCNTTFVKNVFMSIKSIEAIAAPGQAHYVGDGFRVHNFIPGGFTMQRTDPFIMLDYNAPFYFEPSQQARGVGVHPHRGFETVTIAYKGKVAHHDSSGNSGIIGEGDVQWMTAAAGVLHKEYHEENFSKTGGLFQMVQLWVNLPAQYKMSKPGYQAITQQQINKYILPANAGQVEVIAGEYEGVKGPATTFSPVHLMNARLNAGGQASFNFPAHYNTSLIVIEGDIDVNNQQVSADHFVLFNNDGETFTISTAAGALVLLLSGEPLREPIAAHGPFVMNTRQQILQAFEDYNAGKFGELAD